MSKFLKLTHFTGREVFVNTLRITSFLKHADNQTRIWFSGNSDDYVNVKEAPEEIMLLILDVEEG